MHSTKLAGYAAVIACCAVAVLAFQPPTEKDFDAFKSMHNKQYASLEQEHAAFRAFQANAGVIEMLKERNPYASFGFSKFADMTQGAFRAMLARSVAKNAHRAHSTADLPAAAYPSELNWVARGAVTAVVEQGDCASDWAFAAIANIEGVNFVQNGHLTPLSIQEILSCASPAGCDGGETESAYTWLLDRQGGNVMTAASWPYTMGTMSNCTYVGKTVGATITSFQNIKDSEASLEAATATYGPIAAGVDASTWQFYESGVMTNCNFTEVDHYVTVVGYNNNAATPYWILKNSWGTSFGMDGYVWIEKGVNACGIKEAAITAFAQKYD